MAVLHEKTFWKKVKGLVGKVPFIPDTVAMYYCMMDPKTPLWAKAQIGGALAYFVAPVDAIPDLIPIAGYGDDAGVLTATLAIVNAYVTEEHRRRAAEFFAS